MGKRLVIVAFTIFFVFGILGSPSSYRKGSYINVTEYPGELCNRKCIENDERPCYFKFTLELYQAMGVICKKCAMGVVEDCNTPQCIVGDGTEKGVMSINRQVPGPPIYTCKGDTIIIDMVNRAHGTAAAIHWHGLHMKKTPYMDGVPYVTQCPSLYGSTFRYWFDATEPGTHFYHSHSGHHKVNGQYGALIVREPKAHVNNSNMFDYDLPEHYILISDWLHVNGEQLFPGLPSVKTAPDSLLINGRGTYRNPTTLNQTNVPVIKYFVKPGKKYRFRVINSISLTLAARLQIQGHSLTIISSDSFDIKPHKCDTLVTNSGERYDFVLTANYTKGDYWIKVTGMGASVVSYALLRYETDDPVSDAQRSQPPFPNYGETYPLGETLNDPTATCSGDTSNSCVTDLTALEEDEELRTRRPDQQLFVAFNNINVPNSDIFTPGSYPHFQNPFSSLTFVGAINNISIAFPASPPLTQPHDINESEYCDDMNWPAHCIGKNYCTCTNRMIIKKGHIVEFIIVDEAKAVGTLNHPFHLHGNKFMVTGLGQHPLGLPMTLKAAKQIEGSEGLPRKYGNDRPPFKDTVSIPSRGYAILRLRANNPGYWLMHCHYEWHLASGMGVIIQVGNPKQMVKAPADFPKCKNYIPKIKMPNY